MPTESTPPATPPTSGGGSEPVPAPSDASSPTASAETEPVDQGGSTDAATLPLPATDDYLMGLELLATAANDRLVGLDALIGGAAADAEAAETAASDASLALQGAIDTEDQARRTLAAASTEQELAVRSEDAKRMLEELVLAKIALQDALVADFVASWKLEWLQARRLRADADASEAAALNAAAEQSRPAREALVAAIDDLDSWRANLLDKLVGEIPDADADDTLASVLAARGQRLAASPAGVDLGSLDDPAPILMGWTEARLMPFAAPAEPSEPDAAADLDAALRAVAGAEADLASVQPGLRAGLEYVRAVAATAAGPGLGLSAEDFEALAVSLNQQELQDLLADPPPPPPCSLSDWEPLFTSVAPSVWLILEAQVGAELTLAASLAANGRSALTTFVEAMTTAAGQANTHRTQINADATADRSPPDPPDSEQVQVYRSAQPFPYGVS